MDNSGNTWLNQVKEEGYCIINNILDTDTIEEILYWIHENQGGNKLSDQKNPFAIRKLFKQIPKLKGIVFNPNMKSLLRSLPGADYFLVKSIFFDKPTHANWFVAFHQDLSIAVDKKVMVPGYQHWTKKAEEFSVQPPLDVLQSIYTIRIHLDDCTNKNGALQVIPQSHKNGIIRPASISQIAKKALSCEVPRGGVLIMQPLLLHASNKSTIPQKRRVLHLEFCNRPLTEPLGWLEEDLVF